MQTGEMKRVQQRPRPNGQAKRACLETCSRANNAEPHFLTLPREVLEIVLSRLSAPCLVAVNSTCKALHSWDACAKLKWMEKIARDKLVALCGHEDAGRWR